MQHVYGFYIAFNEGPDEPVRCTLRLGTGEAVSEHWVSSHFQGKVYVGGIPAVAPVATADSKITLEVSHPERVLRSHLLTSG